MNPYYHGGPAGRAVGDLILPSANTGVRHRCTTKQDETRVFVTTTYSKAAFYAVDRALSVGVPVGKVYRVEPEGPLTPDPADKANPPDAFFCRCARVLEVISPTVSDADAALSFLTRQSDTIQDYLRAGGILAELRLACERAEILYRYANQRSVPNGTVTQ